MLRTLATTKKWILLYQLIEHHCLCKFSRVKSLMINLQSRARPINKSGLLMWIPRYQIIKLSMNIMVQLKKLKRSKRNQKEHFQALPRRKQAKVLTEGDPWSRLPPWIVEIIELQPMPRKEVRVTSLSSLKSQAWVLWVIFRRARGRVKVNIPGVWASSRWTSTTSFLIWKTKKDIELVEKTNTLRWASATHPERKEKHNPNLPRLMLYQRIRNFKPFSSRLMA